MEWSQGYFTGLNYTFGYYPELSPAMLRLGCLCRGVKARIPNAPSYLELGFGQGMSINVHAAGSSGAYWGCDFNPAQTAEARRLSEASGADLKLFDESFEEFAARCDLPEFDIITLHGVWSWVSLANRATIKQIIKAATAAGRHRLYQLQLLAWLGADCPNPPLDVVVSASKRGNVWIHPSY